MQNSPKNFYKKLLGLTGENKAVKYLKKLGYKILERNYKTKLGEIDVIALDKEYTVFIEVKTRKDDSFGLPSEAVDKRKRQKYKLVATQYLIERDLYHLPSRFDVVEIENGKINHILDAFSV